MFTGHQPLNLKLILKLMELFDVAGLQKYECISVSVLQMTLLSLKTVQIQI